MTELTIRPEEIRNALDAFVRSYEPGAATREEVGVVTEAMDGIARVEGMPSVMANELLRFQNGILGLALHLDIREIGVVVLGDFSHIEEGQPVHRTGEVLSVPVGDAFLGRVVDPLGHHRRPGRHSRRGPSTVGTAGAHGGPAAERQGTADDRDQGLDSMTPIGRGQRELIIGDRQTGKTAVAIDTIINQRDEWLSGDPARQVRCIYVAIGQKGTTIAGVRRRWRRPVRWSTPPSSLPRPRTPPDSSTWRPTPGRPSANTGCTPAATSSSSSTT
jgi:F-type H+-transporting ATPase subunit alpha